MPDPIQVERLYQELKIYFESTLSIRHQYTLFRRFIDCLEGSFKKYETYIIQLLDELSVYPNPLSWSGIDPEEIELDLALLVSLNRELGLSEKCENYQRITGNLQEICLLLYSCLNDASGASKYLNKICGIRGLDNNNPTDQSTIFEQLHELLSAKFQTQDNISKERVIKIERLIKQIETIQKKEKGKAFVPVAEIYNQAEPGYDAYGRLRKILVEFYGDAQTDDELIWNMNLYGAEKPSLGQKKSPLLAARRLYESYGTKKNTRFFKGGVRFEVTNAIHDGDSANLAISALWCTRMLEAGGKRERYEIGPHTVLTGDIDDEGMILPVYDRTISLKIRAAFFSWATMLVVPAIQRDVFERELQILREKYPQRKLGLIGIDQLEELFYDRRVATKIIQGRIKYYFNLIRKEQTKAALIPLVVVLLLIIARLVYGPIDMNPDTFQYEGSSMIIKNQHGVEVKRIEVGAQTASLYNAPATIAGYPLAVLEDITGDGIKEVIYGKRNRLNQSRREVSDVTAYSVSGDSVIWSYELKLNYDFPRQSGVTQQEMLIREMGLVQTENGPKLIVNANSYYYFQTIIYQIDVKSGEVDSEYLHIGHIRDIIMQDLTGDGVEEVIMSGINNAYWLASVAILEVNNIHGHSPLTKDYKPAGMSQANELYYLLIPKTVIGNYVNPVMKYNEGKNIYYDIANETIRVSVEEARTTFRNQYGEVMVTVSFDENMRPVGVGTSDVYDIVARQLYEEGEIEEIPDFDYFQTFKDSILYWTGTEFVTTQEYFQVE